MNALLAKQISEHVNILLNGSDNNEITPLYKLYPSLFSEEEFEDDNKDKQNAELELHKAQMEEYAFRFNQRMKRGDR